jgi:hypothetical protein
MLVMLTVVTLAILIVWTAGLLTGVAIGKARGVPGCESEGRPQCWCRWCGVAWVRGRAKREKQRVR